MGDGVDRGVEDWTEEGDMKIYPTFMKRCTYSEEVHHPDFPSNSIVTGAMSSDNWVLGYSDGSLIAVTDLAAFWAKEYFGGAAMERAVRDIVDDELRKRFV